MRRNLLMLVILFACLLTHDAQFAEPQFRTVEEWIAQMEHDPYEKRQEAMQALREMGKPAVPALMSLIEQRVSGATYATWILGDIGPGARETLPRLIQMVRDKRPQPPEESGRKLSHRTFALMTLERMSWAADELVPVFREIAEDSGEEEKIRLHAIGALGNMGKVAIPVLQDFALSDNREIHKMANDSLSQVFEKEGIKTKAEFYTEVIENNLFDPNVPEYLWSTKGIINLGLLHPLTQKVKTAYREQLKKKPDPELAWHLAEVIQDQLGSTELCWATPLGGGPVKWLREDPSESHVSLAEVLTLGLEHAERGSKLWQDIGIGLAKLRLLQGEWDKMNETLMELGWKPIPQERRPFLVAPPSNWESNLDKQWILCDEAMRSGECNLVIRVEKGGQGLQGVHVLVKEWKPPGNVWHSGIRTDTLFHCPQPLNRHTGSFGYGGSDRAMTRYGVSNKTGEIRFEKLPEIPVKLEVLVPTANFPEPGPRWELWMETEPGKMKCTTRMRPDEPPAVVELKAGETVYYPRLFILPQFDIGVDDWAEVDPKTFVLTWNDLVI